MGASTGAGPEVRADRLKKLIQDMVDISSQSGKEEQILQFTEDYLIAAGLNVKKQPVDENRHNIVVLPPKTDEVDLCFVGHLDTVTAHDLDDFGFYEEEDKACGLGTSDMKAGCAAMIEAFSVLAEKKG